jgi:hypothetical protein
MLQRWQHQGEQPHQSPFSQQLQHLFEGNQDLQCEAWANILGILHDWKAWTYAQDDVANLVYGEGDHEWQKAIQFQTLATMARMQTNHHPTYGKPLRNSTHPTT